VSSKAFPAIVMSIVAKLLLFASVPLAALAAEQAEAPVDLTSETLAADDECAAGDDTCALNALQTRKEQMSREEVAEEGADTKVKETAADGEVETAGLAKWYLGRVGESCTQACSSHRLKCSSADFRVASNWMQVWTFASQAGAQCRMSWANDNRHGAGFTAGSPSVCVQSRCGSDMQGTCTYDTMVRATCDGAPATGFQRLCPCAQGSSWFGGSSSPAPVPAPAYNSGYYPASAPTNGGFVPSPQGQYPNSAPVSCSRDTGGTCSFLPCAKSRGTQAVCAKQGSKKKCLCQPGYCAVKGVCKRATR